MICQLNGVANFKLFWEFFTRRQREPDYSAASTFLEKDRYGTDVKDCVHRPRISHGSRNLGSKRVAQNDSRETPICATLLEPAFLLEILVNRAGLEPATR